MIGSFRHKGLAEFWRYGRSRHVDARLVERLRRRLDAMAAAKAPEELRLPGFDFHPLRGLPQRYAVHVNGPWCVTFEWERDAAYRIDLEQYH